MSGALLLWLVTALYAGQALVWTWNGQYAQALIVGGYALANLGLIWSAAP